MKTFTHNIIGLTLLYFGTFDCVGSDFGQFPNKSDENFGLRTESIKGTDSDLSDDSLIAWPRLESSSQDQSPKKTAVKQLTVPVFGRDSVITRNPVNANKRRDVTNKNTLPPLPLNFGKFQKALNNKSPLKASTFTLNKIRRISVQKKRRYSFSISNDQRTHNISQSILCADAFSSANRTLSPEERDINEDQQQAVRVYLATRTSCGEVISEVSEVDEISLRGSNNGTTGRVNMSASLTELPLLDQFCTTAEFSNTFPSPICSNMSQCSESVDASLVNRQISLSESRSRENEMMVRSPDFYIRQSESCYSKYNSGLQNSLPGTEIDTINEYQVYPAQDKKKLKKSTSLLSLFEAARPKIPTWDLVLSSQLPMYQYVPPKRPLKIILTIDGGGSRGLIPLFYLREFNRILGCDLPVDMYVGTSVGAIIATAAITKQLEELHEQFERLVQQIFPSQKWWQLIEIIKSYCMMAFYGYKYPANGRAEAIRSFLTPEMEKTIQKNKLDKTIADLLIPFCSAKSHEMFLYKNYVETAFNLFDAIMASSAAPTYFPPHKFIGKDRYSYEGTDGGVYANHPGLIALMEALKRYPGAELLMISLGTGCCRTSGETTDKLSIISWASKSATLFMDLQRVLVNYSLREFALIFPEIFRYIRINPVLSDKICITDGTSSQFLKILEESARLSISHDGSAHIQFDAAIKAFEEVIGIRQKEEEEDVENLRPYINNPSPRLLHVVEQAENVLLLMEAKCITQNVALSLLSENVEGFGEKRH